MPASQTEFDRFLSELMAYHRTVGILACSANADSYIRGQVYIHQSQYEASLRYKQAANIKAAQNAVIAGIVALSTMYIGGFIMARIAAVAAGEVAVAAAAAAPGLVEIGGVRVITSFGFTLPALTFGETILVEGLFGTSIRMVFATLGAVITDIYKGQASWTDWAKILTTSFGGVFRFGPAPAFFMGKKDGERTERLRAAFEAEIAKPNIKATMQAIDKAFSARMMGEVKAVGKYAPLLFAPRLQLDAKIRQPMQVQVDKITDAIVAKESGFFGGPKRGDVYASVYAQFGANVIGPIAKDMTHARFMIEQQLRLRAKTLDKAFRDWAASVH